MATLLSIQSSLFGEQGQSSSLSRQFVQRWLKANPGSHIIERDLAAVPVPHLDLKRFQAFITPVHERTAEQQEYAALSDALIDELKAADVLVLGVPMYNFSVPSVLRAYFDHVARAGITFRYTSTGSEGLLTDKKAYVFATRGGFYGDDHSQSDYLRQFLAFIGITDVEFVYAEGLAINEQAKLTGINAAQEKISSLLAA